MAITEKTANKLIILIFFISGLLILENQQPSIQTNALGIAFFIAALYGYICIEKNHRFLF